MRSRAGGAWPSLCAEPRSRWRLWWSCDCSCSVEARVGVRLGVSLGVGGELEEQLLQTGAVGAAQLDQRDAGDVGEVTDRLGIGVDPERRTRQWAAGL